MLRQNLLLFRARLANQPLALHRLALCLVGLALHSERMSRVFASLDCGLVWEG